MTDRKDNKSNMNSKSTSNDFKKKLRYWSPWIVLGVFFFPFLLDFAYGHRLLSWFPNSFPADTWFSFIASYFPATIIGMLTIYQANMIHEKDMQYQELLDRYRFVSYKHAGVYRYNEKTECIADWNYNRILSMYQECNRQNVPENWEKGYVFECYIKDSKGIGINDINFRSIEWDIAGNVFVQLDNENAVIRFRDEFGGMYHITMFCYFDAADMLYQKVVQCMTNAIRNNPDYNFSYVTLKLSMTYDEEKEKNLDMRFIMQAQMDVYRLYSIDECYYVG